MFLGRFGCGSSTHLGRNITTPLLSETLIYKMDNLGPKELSWGWKDLGGTQIKSSACSGTSVKLLSVGHEDRVLHRGAHLLQTPASIGLGSEKW